MTAAARPPWPVRLGTAVTAAETPREAAQLERELAPVLAGLPREGRAALRAGVLALELAAALGHRRRPSTVAPAQLAALLERAGDLSALAPAVTALKSMVALAAGARLAGVSTPETHGLARPDPPLDVTDAGEWSPDTAFDAIVVGSGAGGAMAARTLARGGLEVVVIEEGERYGVHDLRSLTTAQRVSALYRDGGATGAVGRPCIMVPQGRGVGGTTLINSGTCFPPPAPVLERWSAEGFAPAAPGALDPLVEEVWRTLRVAPSPVEILGRNAELALAGAERLGWSAAPLARNAPGCGGCCQCAVGCPRNAKYGVHLNALPQACAAGARIVSRARVERVLVANGRACGVLVRRRDGSPLPIRAPLVMVASGAAQTPPLLRRSGLGAHPELGRNLSLHPALTVAGRFAEPVLGWRGVLQSVGVDSFHEGEGILLEATSAPPGLASLALPGFGAGFRRELVQAGHLASVGAMIADAPGGRVHGRRRALMTYRLSRGDGRRLLRAVQVAGRLLFAAGAHEVLTGLRGREHVTSVTDLQDAVVRADPRHLHLAAFHPTGSARAGADAARHPVNGDGRLRGVEGVWLCDASVLPSCPTVNPQVSIMAVALHIAAAALADRRGRPGPSRP